MKIGELFFEIGGKTDELEKSLKDAKKQIALFSAEILATLYAIDRFVESSTRGAIALTNLAMATGESAQAIQHLELAANLSNAGLSAEEAGQKFAAFSKNLYELQHFGTGNAEGFNALSMFGRGFSFAGKSALEVLGDLREAIKGLDDQSASNILDKNGLGGFLPVLKLSNEEFEKLGSNLVRTPEQLESMKRTGEAVNYLKRELEFFKDTIVVDLEPVWKGLVDGIHMALQDVTYLARAFDNLSDSTKHWAEVLGAVVLVALAPVMATLGSLLLLLDDFITYQQGGQSVIGDAEEWINKKTSGLKNPFKGRSVDEINAAAGNAPQVGQIPATGASALGAPPPGTLKPVGDKPTIFDLYPEFNTNEQLKSGLNGLLPSGGKTTNVTQNNSFIVEADSPEAAANIIADKMSNQINQVVQDQGNGKVY